MTNFLEKPHLNKPLYCNHLLYLTFYVIKNKIFQPARESQINGHIVSFY